MALVRGRLGLGSGLRVRARVRVRVRVTVRVSSYLPRGLLHCAVPRMVHVGEQDAPRLQPAATLNVARRSCPLHSRAAEAVERRDVHLVRIRVRVRVRVRGRVRIRVRVRVERRDVHQGVVCE